MTQFAHSNPPRQTAPFCISDIRLDVEVLADRYEVLAALSRLEDELTEETDDVEDEAADDLPF